MDRRHVVKLKMYFTLQNNNITETEKGHLVHTNRVWQQTAPAFKSSLAHASVWANADLLPGSNDACEGMCTYGLCNSNSRYSLRIAEIRLFLYQNP